MRRQQLGAAAIGFCLMTISVSSTRAQAVGEPSGYGGFGGEYVQAPSLYYPFPGVIESRFGTYFTVPVVPPMTVESPVEAATIDATNAAHRGVHPVDKAKADADAKAEEDGADKATVDPSEAKKAARKRPQRTYARGYQNAPAPYRRELPRGSLADLNQLPAGVPAYSPYARYQTYGQAYGMGPYGSNSYSQYWHGYAPMDGYSPAAPLP